jgi:hypothetical protein
MLPRSLDLNYVIQLLQKLCIAIVAQRLVYAVPVNFARMRVNSYAKLSKGNRSIGLSEYPFASALMASANISQPRLFENVLYYIGHSSALHQFGMARGFGQRQSDAAEILFAQPRLETTQTHYDFLAAHRKCYTRISQHPHRVTGREQTSTILVDASLCDLVENGLRREIVEQTLRIAVGTVPGGSHRNPFF